MEDVNISQKQAHAFASAILADIEAYVEAHEEEYAKFLRSCSVSIQEQTDKSERKHLKRVLQFALAVFPKSATFIDPSKGTLNDPAFRKDSKCVEFIALHNLNICARKSVDGVGKIFSGIASIHQNLLEHRQVIGYITIVVNHINCSVPVGHIGSCYHDHVGQP